MVQTQTHTQCVYSAIMNDESSSVGSYRGHSIPLPRAIAIAVITMQISQTYSIHNAQKSLTSILLSLIASLCFQMRSLEETLSVCRRCPKKQRHKCTSKYVYKYSLSLIQAKFAILNSTQCCSVDLLLESRMGFKESNGRMDNTHTHIGT